MGTWYEDQMEGIGTKAFSAETINSQKQQGITEIVITFDGSFNKNLFTGFGTATYENGSTYTGNWQYGDRNGFGQLILSQNYYYRGHFSGGSYHGRGTLRNVIEENDDVIFNENFIKVTSIVQNYGGEYIGEFKSGKANGFGILTLGSGSRSQIFKGYYSNDRLDRPFRE